MKKIILSFFLVLCALPAHAGGPFFVDRGYPALWQDRTVNWVVDRGDLNAKISNQAVIGWITELFGIWQSASLADANGSPVKAVDINVVYRGLISEDVTSENYLGVVNNSYDQGNVVFIFDSDGSIVDNVIGEGSSKYVVGFASPVTRGLRYFAGGVVVMNGLFIDGSNQGAFDISVTQFKAAMLHEIGHIFNLDHTQANIEAYERMMEGDLSLEDEIPTMFPRSCSDSQFSLHTDDVVALAEQYPSRSYLEKFCRVSGELLDVNNEGFQGADVVARALEQDSEWSDVRTIVSGVMYRAGTRNGSYTLAGLLPGRHYVVGYRAVNGLYNGGSSIAPFDPPRSNVVAGIVREDVVVCEAGGEKAQLSKASVEVTAIDPSDSSSDVIDWSSFDQTSPGGGCSLIIPRGF